MITRRTIQRLANIILKNQTLKIQNRFELWVCLVFFFFKKRENLANFGSVEDVWVVFGLRPL